MKHSRAAAMAGTLWVTIAQGQALPASGPGSSIPLSPDDTPLVRRASDYPVGANGLMAGTPGPYLPNPGDPVEALLNDPGFARGQE